MSQEELADVIFLLHGVGDGVPNVRLVQELPKLTGFARRIFCLAQNADRIKRQFHNTNIQALGLLVRSGEPERVLVERLQKLHEATHAFGKDLSCLAR